MWDWILAAGLMVVFVVFMPWAVDAMRNSRRPSGSGGLGGALLEMQSFIAPSTTHLIEAQEEKVVEAPGDSETEKTDSNLQ